MAVESKRSVYLSAAVRYAGMAAIFGLIYLWIRPTGNEPRPVHLIVGDPLSACGYPAETFSVQKALEFDGWEKGSPIEFDEFIDWDHAKSAGYIPCRQD